MIHWATRRPAVVLSASVAILLAGGVSFTRLALATRTSVELPRLNVNATWPGASAELVETYITSPIESAIQGVRGVRRTSSQSRDETASLTVELEPKADVQLARLGILERLELLRPEFPPGSTPPSVSNYVPQNLEEQPLLMFTVSGPYTPGTLQKLADEQVNPRLSSVPGVAGINIQGGTELGVSVSYDARLLRQLNISPAAIGTALNEARIVRALGEERFGSTERQVVVRDQPQALEELGALPVTGPGGHIFRLGELATIRPEEDARGRFFRINGNPAIALSVSRLPAADAIKTVAAVRAALAELEPTLPPGVRFRVVADDSIELAKQLRDLIIRGSIAFIAVTVVLLLLLRNARAVTLVMASAAVAVAGTALGLFLLDIPANLLTLAGLGMGIGILVHNGVIVVSRLGTQPDTAEGRATAARRILPAVVGSTLTTGIVLLPFLYLQGDARAAFVPFAAAFALALAWSVISAVLLVPALGAGHRVRQASWPRARRAYTRLVVSSLRWRWATLVGTVAVLGVLTWGFVKKVPRFAFGGYGGDQRTTLSASLSFPRGSDPASLDWGIRELEQIVLRGYPEVEQVTAQSWGTSARMSVLFTRDGQFSGRPQDLEEQLTQRAVFIGGASISVFGQGPGFSSGFGAASMQTSRIRVLGYSYEGVERLALDLKERLERIPRVRDVNVNAASFFARERGYAVTLDPDREALARFGITAAQFTQAVAREVRGPVGRQLIEIGGDEIPVTVKASGARERSLDELREALIPTATGTPVRIGDVAAVGEREAINSISREDQQYVRIVAYEFRGPGRLAQRTHRAFLASIAVPAGYSVSVAQGGFGYVPDESERGLWLVFGVGLVLVILSVAVVFDSVWGAWMVFLAIPLALAGVIAAFWAAKAGFTREAAVGVILVVGLAVNQAILLIDAALERRRARRSAMTSLGLTATDVVRAAASRSGVIVLVTVTSLASLIPLAVGTELTNLFGAIALATAGGTVFGTFGAMLVMPALLVGRRRRAAAS
ncbi:MAG TPA: efflux RND transporter permease subunit [Gemmatimonadaceae bacterium]|nr:efflux RND transporter permease subunit [Gemmatimonadaceae bacterium]